MSLDYEALPERGEIQQETNPEVLTEWHENILDLLDNIKSQVAAYNLFDFHDEDEDSWAIRTRANAGYVGTALRQIERRMVEVGLELPLTVGRKERDRIRFLQGLVNFLQRLCDRNEIDHGTDRVSRPKDEKDIVI